MKKILFIDRDGTLIREPQTDYQVDSLDKFSFYPGVITFLSKIVNELDYILVMVTNQDGLGMDCHPEDKFWPYQELTIDVFRGEGIKFRSVHIDRHFEKDNSPYRKPGTAMLKEYIDAGYDLARSFVIGDRWSDMKLASHLGSKGIYINEYDGVQAICPEDLSTTVCLQTDSWSSIYRYLKQQNRMVSTKRTTKETSIVIHLDLDGTGVSDISTGLDFFDHMLEQIAKHGGVDLIVKSKGDLHIDEHHTIEDTAITLGAAFKEAVAKKVGMQRYGFCLPMDDCLAQVAIDFGGRSWIEWDVTFQREKVGDVPTELFYHFFKSFSDSADCNLNIKAEGDNEHHKIEAIFKSFARAIKDGVNRDATSDILPSTKGVL